MPQHVCLRALSMIHLIPLLLELKLCVVTRSFYGESIPGHVLADRLAAFVHVFTLYWYVR